ITAKFRTFVYKRESRRRLRAARAQDLLDLALDLLQVHELSVHRREADVRDLVEVAQAVHDHLADLAARDLHPARPAQLRLDVVDDGPQPLRRDVALLGRLLQAVEQLLRVEVLAAAVLLGDEERHRLDALVRRESLPALQALTPPSNRLPHLGVARVDDLQVVMAAVRAAHFMRGNPSGKSTSTQTTCGCAGTPGC